MVEASAHDLPVTITDPDSVRTGELFLSDLLSLGLWEADIQKLIRAICTFGERYREFTLTGFVVADRLSAVLEYEDETLYQVEFLFDDKPVTDTSVRKLEDYVREDDWKLVALTDQNITRRARKYTNSKSSTDLLNVECQCQNDPGPW
jgi:hypothetical protein